MKTTKHILNKWEEYKELLYKKYKNTNMLKWKNFTKKDEYMAYFEDEGNGYFKAFLEDMKVLKYGLKNGKIVFIQGSTYNQWDFRILYKNDLYNFGCVFKKLICSSYRYDKHLFILGGYGYSRTCQLWYSMVYCVDGKANE